MGAEMKQEAAERDKEQSHDERYFDILLLCHLIFLLKRFLYVS